MLKIGLSRQIGGSPMAPQSDTRTLYVLVSSLAGTVLSLAFTCIFVPHSFHPLVAYFASMATMPCIQSTYRGYTIGLEQTGSVWFITVSPKTPDLPILRFYCTKAMLKSEADAIAEAKSRVDRVLAS